MDLNKPLPFTPNKNEIGKDWRIWKEGFLIYLKLSGGYENYTEEDRALLLLNLMGSEAVKAMENMLFDHPNEKNDMDILIMKFDEIFDPLPNEILERYKFFSRAKGAKEDIENYVAVLKEKAIKCNFGSQTEKLIIDMVIRNMNKEYRAKIFQIEDLTLPDIIQHYKYYIINTEQLQMLSKNIIETLSFTNQKDVENMKNANKKKSMNCSRCGTQHVQKSCPADGYICGVCNEKNHFDKFCTEMSTQNVKSKESKSKPCTKCKTHHPFKPCPLQNEECKSRPACSKCGTNHRFKQCPAFDEICLKCNTKGHFTSKCNKKEAIKPISIGNNYSEKNSEALNCTTTPPATYKNLMKNVIKYCQWCESRHDQGKCLHDPNCTSCDKFPHNICFQCKKNPHADNCYYKLIITLPEVVSSHSNRSESNIPACFLCGTRHLGATCPTQRNSKCYRCNNFDHLTEECPLSQNFSNRQNVNPEINTAGPSQHTNNETIPTCFQCGTRHLGVTCPTQRTIKCYKCNNFGHLTKECPLYKDSTNRQYVNPGTNTAGPLLQDYVTVKNREKPNTLYFDKIQQKNSNRHPSNSQFDKTNKRNEKSDSCTIS